MGDAGSGWPRAAATARPRHPLAGTTDPDLRASLRGGQPARRAASSPPGTQGALNAFTCQAPEAGHQAARCCDRSLINGAGHRQQLGGCPMARDCRPSHRKVHSHAPPRMRRPKLPLSRSSELSREVHGGRLSPRRWHMAVDGSLERTTVSDPAYPSIQCSSVFVLPPVQIQYLEMELPGRPGSRQHPPGLLCASRSKLLWHMKIAPWIGSHVHRVLLAASWRPGACTASPVERARRDLDLSLSGRPLATRAT